MKLGSQNKVRQRLYLRLVIGVLVVLCALVSVSVIKRYQIEREMAARLVEIEAEYQALLERKATLEERVKYLEDDRSVEAEIRRSFDVAREGEQVVIILDEPRTALATDTVPEPPPPAPWYIFWR